MRHLPLVKTRALQPVATCRQSPYLDKPAIVVVTSFSYITPTALATREPAILIMTSFSMWRHSLLSWPRPALRKYVTYVTYVRTRYDVWYIKIITG